jgi:hypothetical protein
MELFLADTGEVTRLFHGKFKSNSDNNIHGIHGLTISQITVENDDLLYYHIRRRYCIVCGIVDFCGATGKQND